MNNNLNNSGHTPQSPSGDEGRPEIVKSSSSSANTTSILSHEMISPDRSPKSEHICEESSKYMLYYRSPQVSCQFFGVIFKEHQNTLIQMGDIVHDGFIFVCATLVDQSIHKETRVEIFITLMVNGELLNRELEGARDEYVYETIEEFATKSGALFDSSKRRTTVIESDLKTKLMKSFKVEMTTPMKTEQILSGYLHHMKKTSEPDGTTTEESSPNEDERRANGDDDEESSSDEEKRFQTPQHQTKQSTTKSRAKQPPSDKPPLRPQSVREAARKTATRYSPQAEPKRKPSSAAPIIKPAAPVKPAAKSSNGKSKKGGKKDSVSSYYGEWDDSDSLPSFDDSYYSLQQIANNKHHKPHHVDLTISRSNSESSRDNGSRTSARADGSDGNNSALAALTAQLEAASRREEALERKLAKSEEKKASPPAAPESNLPASPTKPTKPTNIQPPQDATFDAAKIASILQSYGISPSAPAPPANVPPYPAAPSAPAYHGGPPQYHHPPQYYPPPYYYPPYPPAPAANAGGLDPNVIALVAMVLGNKSS